MKEKKELSVWILIILIFILIAVVIGLFIIAINSKKQENFEMEQKLAQLQQELEQMKTQETVNTPKNESTILNQNNAEDTKYEEIKKELEGKDRLFVTNVIKNSDNTYTLQGVIYSDYTLTEKEFNDILKKGNLSINGEKYIVKETTTEDDVYGAKYGLYRSENEKNANYVIKTTQTGEYRIECQAQIRNVWKLTDIKKQITVDKNISVKESNYGEIKGTVEAHFGNYENKEPNENINYCVGYTFEFENDKCISVEFSRSVICIREKQIKTIKNRLDC